MQALTSEGRQAVADLARRHGVSEEATRTMLAAVVAGQGSMAQFSHPEFGGSGQWMRGGMTMVGDMFNSELKSRVDALCSELSALLAGRGDLFERSSEGGTARGAPAGAWWPNEFGAPSASGSQNGVRYAVFEGARRLAVETAGRLRVYDTLDHRIGGVSQLQSSGSSLTFTSQHGPVDVASLPLLSADGRTTPTDASPLPPFQPAGQETAFSALESLAALHAKGVLTDTEFTAKKAELLRRI